MSLSVQVLMYDIDSNKNQNTFHWTSAETLREIYALQVVKLLGTETKDGESNHIKAKLVQQTKNKHTNHWLDASWFLFPVIL